MLRFQPTSIFALLCMTLCAFHVFSRCSAPTPKQLDNVSTGQLVMDLQGNDQNKKRDAAFTLSRRVQDDKKRPEIVAVRDKLKDSLDDKDIYTRLFISHTLASLGDSSDKLLATYEMASKEENSWCRIQVCCGVRKNKVLLLKSLSLLQKSLDDKDKTVLWEALQSLSLFDSIESKNTLHKVLDIASNNLDTPAIQRDALAVLRKTTPAQAANILELTRKLKVHDDVADEKEQTIKRLVSQAAKSK